jgi:5-formyltetrahydrofolate cyclo-ligase
VLRGALPAGAELLLPVLRDDLDLDWAPWTGADALVAAGRGMREPAGPRRGVSAVAGAELVVVPALAVDRRGLRLGRGGGSYDRARPVPATAWTVALLHDGELVERLLAEPHDRPVRAVITPAGGLRTLTGGGSVAPHTPSGRIRAR